MTAGLVSEITRAASAMAPLSSERGRCHLPVIRNRVTWTPTSAGAYFCNWGSVRRLLDGMMRPMRAFRLIISNYSGRHHLDATNKMILYPLPHKSIEKKFFLLDSD